jgi:hypothetical protein
VPIKPIDLSDFVGIDPEAALPAIVDLGFIDGKRDERNAIDGATQVHFWSTPLYWRNGSSRYAAMSSLLHPI